jgi:hypothetical protein
MVKASDQTAQILKSPEKNSSQTSSSLEELRPLMLAGVPDKTSGPNSDAL